MIGGNVPGHLIVGAKTGFLQTAMPKTLAYAQLATTLDMTAKSIDLVDLGGSPLPTESTGKPELQDFIEKKLTVRPKDWEIFVWISHNAVKDDQTGELDRKVRAAGQAFQRHIAQRVFKLMELNASLGYDGLPLFDHAHVDAGAFYVNPQDNFGAAALSLNSLENAMIAARAFMDDQGNMVDLNYDLLIVPPALERTAAGITSKNLQPYVVSSQNDTNPYAGTLGYITTSQFGKTTWVLAATGEATKPVIVVMREIPNLQHAWFDPTGADGGRYYFKFYGRYDVYPGDWRLVYRGK